MHDDPRRSPASCASVRPSAPRSSTRTSRAYGDGTVRAGSSLAGPRLFHRVVVFVHAIFERVQRTALFELDVRAVDLTKAFLPGDRLNDRRKHQTQHDGADDADERVAR